jgi:hypothetical protein
MYSNEETVVCKVFKIKLGKNPKHTVLINRGNNSINSLLVISIVGFKNLEKLPYTILL